VGNLNDVAGTVSTPTVTLTLAPVPESARHARHAIASRGLDADLAHTVSLLVTEVVGNAIRHAGGGEIHVGATLAPGFARVEVLDSGPGFDPDHRTKNGFGLRLVDKLATQWGVRREAGCTRVWFEVDRRRRRFERAR
jgi:anti-sigma regulatory factor (Ser/Thr protein kinase)